MLDRSRGTKTFHKLLRGTSAKKVKKHWLKEWSPALNARSKWDVERANLKIGYMVLVLSQKTPRAHWPLARIINVHPDLDGRVRIATAQTGTTPMKRPITHLRPLEYKVTLICHQVNCDI